MDRRQFFKRFGAAGAGLAISEGRISFAFCFAHGIAPRAHWRHVPESRYFAVPLIEATELKLRYGWRS